MTWALICLMYAAAAAALALAARRLCGAAQPARWPPGIVQAFVYTDPDTGERLRIDFPTPASMWQFQGEIWNAEHAVAAQPPAEREEFARRGRRLRPEVYGWTQTYTPPRPADDQPWTYGRKGWPTGASYALAERRLAYWRRHHTGGFVLGPGSRGSDDEVRLWIRQGLLVREEPPLEEPGEMMRWHAATVEGVSAALDGPGWWWNRGAALDLSADAAHWASIH